MKPLMSGMVVVALVLGISSNARAQIEITLLSPNPIEKTEARSCWHWTRWGSPRSSGRRFGGCREEAWCRTLSPRARARLHSAPI